MLLLVQCGTGVGGTSEDSGRHGCGATVTRPPFWTSERNSTRCSDVRDCRIFSKIMWRDKFVICGYGCSPTNFVPELLYEHKSITPNEALAVTPGLSRCRKYMLMKYKPKREATTMNARKWGKTDKMMFPDPCSTRSLEQV